MSLGKQMIEQLQLLAKEGPESVELLSQPGRDQADEVSLPSNEPGYTTMIVGATQEVALTLFDYDRYSVALRALEVGALQPVEGEVHSYLSAAAAEIGRKLSYLEEPLAVWELDGGEHVAQLRSSPPQRDGDAVSYWEVMLTFSADLKPSARVVRYRWAPGMVAREVVAYPATFALVGRMIDSLVEALREVAV